MPKVTQLGKQVSPDSGTQVFALVTAEHQDGRPCTQDFLPHCPGLVATGRPAPALCISMTRIININLCWPCQTQPAMLPAGLSNLITQRVTAISSGSSWPSAHGQQPQPQKTFGEINRAGISNKEGRLRSNFLRES